jgi:cell wall-associated NlpC family hydrolase
MRNIAKSVGYATASAFGDMIPTVKNTMQSNKNYVENVYASTKEKLTPSDIKQTMAYKSGQELLKNVVNDLRSGNLYNKERQQEAQKQSLKDMGLDFDFDNFDFDSEGNGSSTESETNESGSITNTQNVIINTDGGVGQVVDSSIGKLSRISASAMKLNHMGVSTVSKQMSTMIEFQQDQTARFYTEVSGKMADMASNISQMTGFLGVMTEVTIGGSKDVNRNKSALRSLLGLEGLDVEGIVGIYKNKFMGNTSGYGDMFQLMIKPIIDEFVANPLGMAMKTGIKAILPEAFKSAMGEFDMMFKNLPVMMQGKLKQWENSNNKYKKWASQVFGLDIREDKRLDNFGNYEKGKVAFDGITRRAVVNVIPSLLSKILTAVSNDPLHKEELVYDYEKGIFTTKQRIKQGMEEDVKNFSTNNFETKRYKEEIIQSNKDNKSEDELTEFINKLDEAFDNIAKSSVIINSNTKLKDISDDEEVAKAVLSNFESKSSSGKAKFQRDFLEASQAYTDVYDRIRENESFHNAFDISEVNPFAKKETNKEMAKRMKDLEKLTNNIFGNGNELDVENTMSKKNPFYWLTEFIRKVNSNVADYMFDEDGNPVTDGSTANSNTEESDKESTTSSATSGEKKKSKKKFKFFSSGFKKPNNSDIRPKIDAPVEEEPIFALNNNIADLNENVSKNNKILKGEDPESSANSSAQARQGGNLNISSDDLSFLPRINENILHIIALLEAKFSGDGLPLDKIGKFKDSLTHYKDKTLNFFDRFFTRGKGQADNGNTMVSRVTGRVRGFFQQVFGKSDNRESMLSKIFGSVMDSIRGANGRRSIVETFLGKEGLITTFASGLFSTIGDVVKTQGPKVADFVKNTASTLLSFGRSAFETVLGVGRKGLNKLGEMKDKRREEGKGGVMSMLLGVLTGAGKGIGSLLGSAKDGISSLLGRGKKEDGEGTSSNRKKLSIRDMFDKAFNEKNNLMHVFVDGGNLDRIREVVKVQTWYGHEGSASEQFAEFEARKNKLSSIRQASDRRKRDRKNPNFNPDVQGGMGGIGGLLGGIGGIADVLGGASDLKHLLGGGDADIDPNTRQGRRQLERQQRRQNRRGRFGRLLGGFGAGSAMSGGMDGNTRTGRRQGLFGKMKDGFNSLHDKAFQRRQTSTLRGASGGASKAGLKGGLKAGARALGHGLKFIPGVGLIAGAGMGIMDTINGAKNANEIFETHNATLGQKISAGAGGLLSGLSFGLLDRDKMAQGIHGIGSKIGNFGKGLMGGFGGLGSLNPFDNPMAMMGMGGLGLLAGKSGLFSGLKNLFGGRRSRGSYAEGGVVDYTGKADVHGSKDKPEMVLNSEQTTGFFHYIKQLTEERKKEARRLKEEKLKGEKSRDPMVRTATWMEKLGKFMTVGAGGMFFGGILGAVTGKVSGVFGKVADWFKGIFKPKEAEASSGGSGGGSDVAIGGSLGHISEKYESGGRGAGTIGWDSTGGTSYGTYQIATKTGTMNSFMNFLKSKYPDYYAKLSAGGAPGSTGFTGAWKALASSDGQGFGEAQRAFIGESHYKPAVSKIKQKTGIDVASRSQALQEVAWSVGVQHGSGGAGSLFSNAGVTSDMSDEEIIKKVYAERKNVNKYFSSSTSQVKQSVLNRFNKEEQDVLNFYKNGGNSGGDPSSSSSGSGNVRDKVVQGGKSYEGKLTYSFGGTNIEGGSGDCSGFTSHVFKKYGNTNIGRTTGDQVIKGKEVERGKEQPGDLVFFKDTYPSSHIYGVSHVGIVIGGGKMVHLASKGCRVDSYVDGYWAQHYLMVRSYLSGGSSSGGSSSASASTESAGSKAANWFKNVWDYTKDVWGNAPTREVKASGSDTSYNGGPTSAYNKNTFSALQNLSGAVSLGKGSAYVGSGGDPSMMIDRNLADSRWSLNNNTINNAMNSITKMNSLNNSVSSNQLANMLHTGFSGASPNIPSLRTTTNISGSTAISTALSQMASNAEEISNIQSLLRQMSENGREGNETLRKMLEVLMQIRENSGQGSPFPFPIPSTGSTNGGNGSPTPTSPELEDLLDGV